MKHKFSYDSTTNTATFSLPTEDVAVVLENCAVGIALDNFMKTVYIAGYERAVAEMDEKVRQNLMAMHNVIIRGLA